MEINKDMKEKVNVTDEEHSLKEHYFLLLFLLEDLSSLLHYYSLYFI